MFTVFSTSSAEALQMGLYKEHECPFIGVCSGTLLSLGSFLCKKQHWPSCSLSPFSFSRSTIPKERQECLSEEIAPNGEYLLGGFCSLPGGDNAFLPLEGSGFAVPVTLVKVSFCLSLLKESSHTCPLRMAVRARPLACLKYSASCRGVGTSEVMAAFSLQWRAMEES